MDDPERRAAVRPLTIDDLDAVAAVHIAAFPDSALGRLGPEAVRRSYRWQLEGPHDVVALAAHRRGQLVGFLVGGTFSGSLIGFVRRERWFLAGRVIRHPSLALRSIGRDRLALAARLLLRRTRGKRHRPPAPPAPTARSFGVLAIAVDP